MEKVIGDGVLNIGGEVVAVSEVTVMPSNVHTVVPGAIGRACGQATVTATLELSSEEAEDFEQFVNDVLGELPINRKAKFILYIRQPPPPTP